MTNFDTVREALMQLKEFGGHAYDEASEALTTLAELERTHYTAEDVADASAQGFRDGVASVTAGQEPVAWLVCSVNSDGSLSLEHAAAWKEDAHEHINDAITEHEIEEAASWVVLPAYVAAPVAQQPQPQPQDLDWKHPKIQALIAADARNRIVIDLIWQILKNPDGDFSAMDMEYWDSIHDAVQAAVAEAKAPPKKIDIGDIARLVDLAQEKSLKDIVDLCEQIRYMVGIAERGTGSKCPDDVSPEVFVLNYVKQLEGQQPQAEAVPDVTDAMVGTYLSFVSQATHLQHPEVPYQGTVNGDDADQWRRRLIKLALQRALAAAPKDSSHE